jgi:small subunit ribosomal protein S17
MNEQNRTAKTLTGRVVSSKMNKTIAVVVERMVRHAKYGKYLRRNTKLLAHDEKNECREGDIVIVEASRPISKRKAWRLKQVVSRAEAV